MFTVIGVVFVLTLGFVLGSVWPAQFIRNIYEKITKKGS